MDTSHIAPPPAGTLSYEDIQRLTQEAREEYVRRKAERQRAGREKAARTVAERKREGEACGVILPPGYRRDYVGGTREPVVDVEVAPLAQEAFALAASGMPLRRILAVLTPKGLVSRNGTPMHASSLRAILTNPFYCGMVRVDRELVESRHEAVISMGEFKTVQNMLEGKRKSWQGNNSAAIMKKQK